MTNEEVQTTGDGDSVMNIERSTSKTVQSMTVGSYLEIQHGTEKFKAVVSMLKNPCDQHDHNNFSQEN